MDDPHQLPRGGVDVVPSLERIFAGFAIGTLAGVAIGVPLGMSRSLRRLAIPHIEYWRAMPPPALLPISIILLHSIQNRQKIAFNPPAQPLRPLS